MNEEDNIYSTQKQRNVHGYTTSIKSIIQSLKK